MDAQKYIEMIHDKYFFDYKKMEHKYSKALVKEMIQLLYAGDAKELPLTDTGSKPLTDSHITDRQSGDITGLHHHIIIAI